MDIIEVLKQTLGEDNIKINEPMSKYTSFKTGGTADIFVKIKNIENLKCTLEVAKNNNLPTFILGNGSNILVTDRGIRGIVCKIELSKFEVEEDNEYVLVTIGSGNKNAEIAHKLLNLEITGFEFASRNTRYNRRRSQNECWCIWL